jgi:hypothetical protein
VAARRRKQRDNADREPTRVLRRRAEGSPGLRKLPPDLQELAAGRRDTLRPRRRPKGRIADSRVAGLIAGVANHDARRVYDARCEMLRRALAQGSEPELERQLCDAVLLGLWRARNVTGFDAFVQDVLEIPLERAHALAERGAASRGVVQEQLPDVAVALWLRSEAVLLDHCPEAQVTLALQAENRFQLCVSLPLAPPARAAEALFAIGRSAGGLARVLAAELRPRDRPRE